MSLDIGMSLLCSAGSEKQSTWMRCTGTESARWKVCFEMAEVVVT